MEFEPVIGLEVHAELQTQLQDVLLLRGRGQHAGRAQYRRLPGLLRHARHAARSSIRRPLNIAIRVALALECEVQRTSIFARKNYFYPDLPKGYQISQYEEPAGGEWQARQSTRPTASRSSACAACIWKRTPAS